MLSRLSAFIIKLLGFTIKGEYPYDLKKVVLIAGPHTSYWDFPLGLLIRSAEKIDVKYVGKASLFKPPLGWIMKLLGGVPVDRSKRNNFVDQVINLYKQREKLAVLFAPEGKRRKVEKFKTGFYYIAKGANIPILPIVFDFEHKEIRWLDLVYPTDDATKDLEKIESLYKGVVGYTPKNSFT